MDQQVHVIIMALGGSGSSDGEDALSMTCNEAMRRGIVVCVAAAISTDRTQTAQNCRGQLSEYSFATL